MNLLKKDRVILINQYKILAALDRSQESYYRELIEILEHGYSIFYSMIDEWISDDVTEADGRLVLNILDLYRAIEDVKRVTKDERLLEHPFGVFPGFDGNNESEYLGFSRFLVERQGKFQEQEQYFQRNDRMNSHIPMVEKYHRMLDERKTIASGFANAKLTVEQVLIVLSA